MSTRKRRAGRTTPSSRRAKVPRERAALLVELRRAQETMRADLEAMTRLQRLGTLVLHERNLRAVSTELVDAAVSLALADFGSLALLEGPGPALKVVAQRGLPCWWADSVDRALQGQGIAGTALELDDEHLLIEDLDQAPTSSASLAELYRRAGIRSLQSVALRSRGGQPLGVLTTYRSTPGTPDERALRLLTLLSRQAGDLLERDRAEDDLRRANAQLLETDRRKNEFLGMLAHELRNPLAPIRNSVYILERSEPGSEQAHRAQEVIGRQVEHMTRLVDDLLDVTRISRGKVQLQKQRVDLAELVRQTVDDHRADFTKAGVGLELAVAGAPVLVDGDRTRLAQVVGNLLHNAVKFTAAGGRTTVAVHGIPATGQAVLRVQDTGRGIAPELLPRLFEPFTQADATLDRQKGGLGLGLAVVKGLVELHGGAVHGHSDGPGTGATFTLSLPLCTEAPRPAPTPAQPSRGVHRVLVIEDNVDSAETLKDVLQFLGHTVELAFTGRVGLEKARTFNPHIVICDIGLPEMDGYEVAQAFRASPTLKRLALIALTGYVAPEDLQRARLAGFDAHLAKPASLDALERLLGELHPVAS